MKIKKIVAMLLVTISLVSTFAMSASAANTTDEYLTFSWTSSDRYDYTSWRTKEDTTRTYIKTQASTLPYNGYYVQTEYKYLTFWTKDASASSYLINDYVAYTISADSVGDSNMSGKTIRIVGNYKDTTYTWGDVTIAWSPDTSNQSAYTVLN